MASNLVISSLSFEPSPKLLKDFLIDDTHSCSSNDHFRFYPRKSSESIVSYLACSQDSISESQDRSKMLSTTKTTFYLSIPETKSNKPLSQLLRSRSKAASSTIFAIHKASEMVTKALKYLPFASIKSPSILPLSRKEKYHYSKRAEASVKIKVKDILRWRSFRDLVEEKTTPLDLHCLSPNYRRDNDFTAEDFPSWCYEGVSEGFMKTTRTTDMDHKNDEYEEELHTPNSVLDSPFHEDEDVNYEVEEKAYELLVNNFDMINMENNYLLFDFFKHELTFVRNDEKNDEYIREVVRLANNWLSGELGERKRGNYYGREMERWNNLEEEQEEMVFQLESLVMSSLLEELLTDLLVQ